MEINKKTLRTIFLGAAGCIILYWLLHETERVQSFFTTVTNIFSPFVAGAALAFVLNVPMRSIERLLVDIRSTALRRTIALLLTLLAFVLILAFVFYLLVPQLVATIESLVAQLPAFFGGIVAKINSFLQDNPQVMEWVTNNTEWERMNWSNIIQQATTMVGNSLSAIVNGAFSAIGSVAGAMVELVIAVVFAFYSLYRKETLSRQARRLVYSFLPEKFCDASVRVLRMTNSAFANFISGQCLEACILGCLFAVSMAIFRMPYIPLVSVLVAVTALVPLVGAFVGCALGAFFILVDDPLLAVWFVVMFLVLQQIEGNVIYPRVVGVSIGLPGMWVLMAVTVGGELMGIAGMLIMIPIASVAYALLREITGKRLEARGIPPEKLLDQPPELRSRIREKRAESRKKREHKKRMKFKKKQ
ncbi:MAG TPA: AI-2E family transporter [Candidatus Faecousia intestinigallinarum]|nr:AI-2E family transporter [Candidatus Faecousia intestinigallinarum]